MLLFLLAIFAVIVIRRLIKAGLTPAVLVFGLGLYAFCCLTGLAILGLKHLAAL